MAIIAITGKPGAGKSYAAVARAAQAHADGIPIWTDLPLRQDGLDAWASRRTDKRRKLKLMWIPLRRWGAWARVLRMKKKGLVAPGHFKKSSGAAVEVVGRTAFGDPEVWKKALNTGVSEAWSKDGKAVRGVLIVIDEIAIKLREASKPELAQILGFLETHRHYYATILLCMQSHTQLDELKQIKALVEQWCEITNFRLAMGAPVYQRTTYTSWYDKPGAKREPLWSGRGVFRKEIFACYRSHAMGTEEGEGEAIEGVETVQKMGGNPLSRGIIKMVLVVCLSVGFFFVATKVPDMLQGAFGFGSGGKSIRKCG